MRPAERLKVRKLEGNINGTPVYSDPNCPPKMMYFMNDTLFDIGNIDDSTAVMTFRHIYRSTFNQKGKDRHACLINGYWCWRNLLRHPLDIIKFIKRKVK